MEKTIHKVKNTFFLWGILQLSQTEKNINNINKNNFILVQQTLNDLFLPKKK